MTGQQVFNFADNFGIETYEAEGLYKLWSANPTPASQFGANTFIHLNFKIYVASNNKPAMAVTRMWGEVDGVQVSP